MSIFDEVVEMVLTNTVSWTIVAATFNYADLIPTSENLIQWTVGLCVGVSVMVYNVIRGVHLYDDLKHKRAERSKPQP